MVTRTVWRVGMRHIGDAKQYLSEFFLQAVCIGLQSLFLFTHGAAALHEGFSVVILLVATEKSHLLRHVVNAGAKSVPFRRDVAEAAV
jgi:hypothetical protein